MVSTPEHITNATIVAKRTPVVNNASTKPNPTAYKAAKTAKNAAKAGKYIHSSYMTNIDKSKHTRAYATKNKGGNMSDISINFLIGDIDEQILKFMCLREQPSEACEPAACHACTGAYTSAL